MTHSLAATTKSPSAQSHKSQPDRETSGVLIIDKPEGLTSFDVVTRVRRTLNIDKVGHCGTLDPFATGVLLLCLNQSTRIADQLLTQDKVYHFTIHLGVETNTLDLTGQVTEVYKGHPKPAEMLDAALMSFRGAYLQDVPRYAAVKIRGKRLYQLSRDGVDVELPKREVYIRDIRLLSYLWPKASLEVHCSKGTYIRQLASDIGRSMGCGGHVSELRRIASGRFSIEQAISFKEFPAGPGWTNWQDRVLSIAEVLAHLPAVVIADDDDVKRLRNGLLNPDFEALCQSRTREGGEPVRILDDKDSLIALCWPREGNSQGRRLRVFPA